MLIGQYEHSIDAKGRVIMPVKLKKYLGDEFIITRGLDDCLFVFAEQEWSSFEEKIRSLPLSKARDVQRYFFSGAALVSVDKQGRILIPQALRSAAYLDKEAVIIGAYNRVEIWDKAKWERAQQNLVSDSIAQVMDEIGF